MVLGYDGCENQSSLAQYHPCVHLTTSLQITNGSAATALSTIITILASMAYYDQFPNFAETTHNVSTTYFEPFLFPQSFRGFTVVLAIVVVH